MTYALAAASILCVLATLVWAWARADDEVTVQDAVGMFVVLVIMVVAFVWGIVGLIEMREEDQRLGVPQLDGGQP